jgi:hypothetical protein
MSERDCRIYEFENCRIEKILSIRKFGNPSIAAAAFSQLDAPSASQYLAVNPPETEVRLADFRSGCDNACFPARPEAASGAVSGQPVGEAGAGRVAGR